MKTVDGRMAGVRKRRRWAAAPMPSSDYRCEACTVKTTAHEASGRRPPVCHLRCRFWALFLVLLPAAAFARDVGAPGLSGKWTKTDPPVNFVHIEFGEINRRGEAVGYHHRPNRLDPPGARVLRVVQPPDASGVYRARVALRDRTTGAWVQKKSPSTFYPDAMTPDEVIDAILAAFHDADRRHDGRFVGASRRGFMIEGWYQDGRIDAAYPLRGP